MKKVLLLAITAMTMMVGNLKAQTFHVISFCNTLDPNIGCEVDRDRIVQEAGGIGALLGYEVRFYCGEGEDCSKENLMNTVNSLNCGKDDIVFFYYSGHGIRSSQDNSEFPQMCLKYQAYDQDKFVAVYTVVEKLQTKGAHFTLVMTDCCNNPVSMVSPKTLMSKDGGVMDDNTTVARNLRKLFVETQGMVIVTSSKKGQTSLGGKRNGGLFTDQFFGNSLYEAAKGKIPATWNDVLQNTYGLVKNLAAQVDNHLQEPYFEINTNNAPSSSPDVTPNTHVSPVVAVDSNFANELATLLDASHSEDWRLNQANYLANKYFTSDAKVATVGRNGTTIIEYESARDFLCRIAVSKLISKMNVIKETTDSSGKRNYIKVQEIRKSK